MDPRDIYDRVLDVVNKYLVAVIGLSVDAMDELNPSAEVIARKLKILASVLSGVSSTSFEDENMHINSLQCCLTMEKIAIAVSKKSEEDVVRLIEELILYANVP